MSRLLFRDARGYPRCPCDTPQAVRAQGEAYAYARRRESVYERVQRGYMLTFAVMLPACLLP